MIDALVPAERKVHLKNNFTRSIIEKNPKLFSMAQIPAKRILRRCLKEDDEDPSFRPNLGLPGRVTGAINQEDVMKLQKIKQDIFSVGLHKDWSTAKKINSRLSNSTDISKKYNKTDSLADKAKSVSKIKEKNENTMALEEQLNPLFYSKVFGQEKILVFKPKNEGNFVEVFQNHCLDENKQREEERQAILQKKEQERMRQTSFSYKSHSTTKVVVVQKSAKERQGLRSESINQIQRAIAQPKELGGDVRTDKALASKVGKQILGKALSKIGGLFLDNKKGSKA